MVIFGLYDPVHNDLRKDELARILLRAPSELRHPGEWMVPMDDEILVLFHSAHPVLTLAIISCNIDRSREGVNRRLSELEPRDLIEWVERGKYRIPPSARSTSGANSPRTARKPPAQAVLTNRLLALTTRYRTTG